MKIEEKHPCKLLVEGNDDQHSVWAICEQQSIPETFDVVDCNSVEKAFKQLESRLMYPENNQIIGIIVDADDSPSGRFASFCQILNKTGKYDCSGLTLTEEGLVISSKDDCFPKVGLWIMPDNNTEGMLEDFAILLAGSGNSLMENAEKALEVLEKESIQKYKPVYRSKAKIHTFLAWQEAPGMPIGQAITSRVLNSDSQMATLFIRWIKTLFF